MRVQLILSMRNFPITVSLSGFHQLTENELPFFFHSHSSHNMNRKANKKATRTRANKKTNVDNDKLLLKFLLSHNRTLSFKKAIPSLGLSFVDQKEEKKVSNRFNYLKKLRHEQPIQFEELCQLHEVSDPYGFAGIDDNEDSFSCGSTSTSSSIIEFEEEQEKEAKPSFTRPPPKAIVPTRNKIKVIHSRFLCKCMFVSASVEFK